MLSNQVGEGTRAEIWLPAATATAIASDAGADDPDAHAPMPRLRVLLVDDHDGVRATTAALIEELGHEVAALSSGADMLASLADGGGACDLLVTDYAMPQMSGAELIRRAREQRPSLAALIITGYAEGDALANRPADVGVLTKPFSIGQLRRALTAAAAEPAAAPPVPVKRSAA